MKDMQELFIFPSSFFKVSINGQKKNLYYICIYMREKKIICIYKVWEKWKIKLWNKLTLNSERIDDRGSWDTCKILTGIVIYTNERETAWLKK